jgi:hypothetical protein
MHLREIIDPPPWITYCNGLRLALICVSRGSDISVDPIIITNSGHDAPKDATSKMSSTPDAPTNLKIMLSTPAAPKVLKTCTNVIQYAPEYAIKL